MNVFGSDYAQLYDKLYHDKDYRQEVDYLCAIFQKHGQGTVNSLLDFGCGTGRHAIDLAQRGMRVLGVERSPDMKAIALQRASDAKCFLEVTDSIPDYGTYDAIFSLFAVINYLPDRNELRRVLRQFRQRLRPGGVIVLETWNGAAVPFLSEPRKTKEIFTSHGKIIRESFCALDWREQLLNITFRCTDESGSSVEETHQMRYYTPAELEALLGECGLRIRALYPAYEWREPTKEDFNLIFVCELLADHQ